MITVLIVDDHPTMRAGLAQLLETQPDIEVVAMASDGLEAVDLSDAHQPNVVLMDISMPNLDGVGATERIVASRPDAHVVILTSFAERERINAALDAGAIGYLLKDAEPDEVLRGIRAAAAGEAPFSAKAATALLARRVNSKNQGTLTDRERQVLSGVARGLANKQIARELSISEKTVKTHLSNIYSALGVTDRTQAALWAQRKGLFDEPAS